MNTTVTTTGRALDAPALNGQPQTLAEIVDHEALGYRAWGTQARPHGGLGRRDPRPVLGHGIP